MAFKDWKYHFINLLIFISGFGMMYVGYQVVHSEQLANIGIWTILFSVLAFFAINIAYMMESSEPDNMVRRKSVA